MREPVYEFDYIADPALLADCHARYWQLRDQAPEVFWTNANGGHWVCNSAATVTQVLRHPEYFSSRFLSIPPNPGQPRMIPEMLDPPQHRAYRQVLRPFFESKAIAPLETQVEEWTERLLGDAAARGECEFVGAIASRLPVAVFMELFGFPIKKFDEFRGLVVDFFSAQATPDERNGLGQAISVHIAELIQQRIEAPCDDMISKIIASDFVDEAGVRRLDFGELMSIGFLMFLAGLDTVTNAMSFGMRHLAHDRALQEKVIADPGVIPDLVEELLRRYAFVATPRYVVEDVELAGVIIPGGDLILAPLPMVGWDNQLNAKPEEVSVERPFYRHAAFGSGIHTCLGLHLARMELAVFYRQWFERMGRFRQIVRGDEGCRGGSVMALERLHLAWEPKGEDGGFSPLPPHSIRSKG
ncbi:cytochrome P450 [Novosphingobium sp. Gsoil 351]|uniref:cytochrome P450 n=1 Tax=Novosphingobium sp. Gsoil 351 TaxID=2675225 RepID=UPI0012B4A17D|nr:cytochrome P450 [Novosphingobium sp. Gsoil 351]QGN54196.1 cytochrome P450 [Novosphingobium sp. Gsoil 351]